MAMNARRKGLLWGTVVAVAVLLAVVFVQASAEPAEEGVPGAGVNAQRSGEEPSLLAARTAAVVADGAKTGAVTVVQRTPNELDFL